MTLEWVIDRAVENALQRLATVQLPSPAYAIALQAADPELLYAVEISVGLERDRQRILESASSEGAFYEVWNAWEFAAGGDAEPQLAADEEFLRAQDAVREQLRSQGHVEPGRHVLKLIARRLGAEPPISPVTPDFVAYAFDDRFDEGLVEDIRFSGSPDALALLERKGLLPTRF
jgi:hypothetical protein